MSVPPKIVSAKIVTASALLATLALMEIARADSVAMNLPPGDYAMRIGNRLFPDPSGATHTRQEVRGKVVVAIFSAPNMSQGHRQEKWADLLATGHGTKVADEVALFLVEDMTQAGVFKGMALDSMKKQFTPHSRPFLILDQDGSILKKLGIAHNETAILIYDRRGRLRDVETNLDSQDVTLHRVKVITTRLLGEQA